VMEAVKVIRTPYSYSTDGRSSGSRPRRCRLSGRSRLPESATRWRASDLCGQPQDDGVTVSGLEDGTTKTAPETKRGST
jgi:hypothetical protein